MIFGLLISLSGFFKHFKNPIEMVPFQLSPNNIQPKNVNEAYVYGAELEFNLVRWMRLAFFGNYRYTSKLFSSGNINENALNGWSAGITLKVGGF